MEKKRELSEPCEMGRAVTVQDKYFMCNDEWVLYDEFMRDVLRENTEEGITFDESQEIVEDH